MNIAESLRLVAELADALKGEAEALRSLSKVNEAITKEQQALAVQKLLTIVKGFVKWPSS